MSPAELREMAWLLMLIPFAIVLGIGIFFIYCAGQRASRNSRLLPDLSASFLPAGPFRSQFEQPPRWLAVKAANSDVVQRALKLHHPIPCSWEEGMARAREDKLFISPPIDGWILVVGSGLPEPGEDVDECYRFLVNLSRKLGQVQFFSFSRAVNFHAWALVERGHVYRAYSWAGEVLWNQGPITAAERELSLTCFAYGTEMNPFSAQDALAVNSEKVNQLAARWSIDPAAISPAMWSGRGIVGEFLQPEAH